MLTAFIMLKYSNWNYAMLNCRTLNGWTLYRAAPWHQTSKGDNFLLSKTVTKLFTSNSNRLLHCTAACFRLAEKCELFWDCLCFGGRRSGQVGDAVLRSVFYLGFLHCCAHYLSCRLSSPEVLCTKFSRKNPVTRDEKLPALSEPGLSVIKDVSNMSIFRQMYASCI